MTSFNPVQGAVYAVLTGDAVLRGMVSGVYDEVPERAAPPYIRIGEAYEIPDNAHGVLGRQTIVTVHIWSRQRGFSEATAIADRVSAVLDHQPLSVPGRHHVATRYEFGQTVSESSGPGLRHVVMRFRVLTEIEE